MASFDSRDALPEIIFSLINDEAKSTGMVTLLSHLLGAIRGIANGLRDGDFSHEHAGTHNVFGDHQLVVDVATDEVIMRHLRESGVVHVAASEETPVEVDCGGAGYSVAFDPLDGSSIIDANFAVGTIIGIFPGNGLLNRIGRELAASAIAQFGPRVTIALALNINNLTAEAISQQNIAGSPGLSMELTMTRTSWEVSKPRLNIKAKGKTFAPGNLRATADNPAYQALVSYWITNKYTLRYSGGLVPDCYHILIKGEGVLSNASSPSAKAKLRLLFEAIPIALLIEGAGGASCVCSCEAGLETQPLSLLDVPVSDLDKRVGVCYGSRDEVARFRDYIFPSVGVASEA